MNINYIMYNSGAISGAITDAESSDAILHAYKYYEYIRNINNDVDKIAENTEFTKDQILMVKNYIFYAEHELDGGYQRFEPDFYMAQSWRRLAFEPKNIKPHDIMLIRHELYEMSLVTQGYPYKQAHDMSNSKGLNYQKMCSDYYIELDNLQNNKKINETLNDILYNKDEKQKR